jgi:hypothetical protein
MPTEQASAGHAFVAGAEALQAGGYAYDFISDTQILQLGAEDGALQSGEIEYRAILLPESRYIPLETFDRIVSLAEEGATVVVYRGLPADVAGLHDLDDRRARFRELLARLRFRPVPGSTVQEATIGEGRFIVGPDLDQLLTRAGVRRETMVDEGLRFIRRRHEDGTTYFIANQGETALDGWVRLTAEGSSAALYDPMGERSGMARIRAGGPGATEVYLQMGPAESRVIRLYDDARVGKDWEYERPAGSPIAIEGQWSIRFVEGGPELPPAVSETPLGSWTELEGEAVKRFSGTAIYTLDLPRPAGTAEGWILDLGTVHQSARVSLNGRALATLIGPRYRVLLPREVWQGENRLEVAVTNLMANRIADLDRRGVFWKKFYNVNFPSRLRENRGANGLFDASAWEPRPSGLVGPVTLTPVEPL